VWSSDVALFILDIPLPPRQVNTLLFAFGTVWVLFSHEGIVGV
jgi:hypothetical protein